MSTTNSTRDSANVKLTPAQYSALKRIARGAIAYKGNVYGIAYPTLRKLREFKLTHESSRDIWGQSTVTLTDAGRRALESGAQ